MLPFLPYSTQVMSLQLHYYIGKHTTRMEKKIKDRNTVDLKGIFKT